MRFLPRALRLLDWATQGANIVGTVLIVGLVLIICVDVIGRETIGVPLRGVPEMVTLSIVAIVFLQVPQAFRAGRLTRSDGLLNTLKSRSPRLVKVMETCWSADSLRSPYRLEVGAWSETISLGLATMGW